MPDTKQFTVWTQEERQRIHDNYFVLYPDRTSDPTDRQVRNAAYSVLPPDRQRDHISPNDPVKKMIYQTLGRPMPIKNQKRGTPKARRSKPRVQLTPEGEQAYLKHASNSKPSVATLQHELSGLTDIRRRVLAIIMAATQILADLD